MSQKGTVPPYRSRFSDWDKSATVRCRSVHTSISPAEAGLFFSPDLVPIVGHYLDFTDELENAVVAPVAYRLGRGIADFAMERRMRLDARRIAVDEMYHALCATEVIDDIAQRAGITPPPARSQPFLRQLEAVFATLDSRLRPLLTIFFAFVSETLITGSLMQVPRDLRVQSSVRHILADHAEDEMRHHAFFADLFGVLWPQLSPQQQDAIGPALPLFINIFLSSDRDFEIESLRQIGLERADAARVIDETEAQSGLAGSANQFAAATLRYVKRGGLFENAKFADAFEKAGFSRVQC
jgi:hypothetical protein